jgi:hypothetical protein
LFAGGARQVGQFFKIDERSPDEIIIIDFSAVLRLDDRVVG